MFLQPSYDLYLTYKFVPDLFEEFLCCLLAGGSWLVDLAQVIIYTDNMWHFMSGPLFN